MTDLGSIPVPVRKKWGPIWGPTQKPHLDNLFHSIIYLTNVKEPTGNGKYVFPTIRTPKRPMSENTVTEALRRLGYTSDLFY